MIFKIFFFEYDYMKIKKNFFYIYIWDLLWILNIMEYLIIFSCNKIFRYNKMWYFLRDYMKDMYKNENFNYIYNCIVSNLKVLINIEQL